MELRKGIQEVIVNKRGLRLHLLALFLILIYIPISLNMFIVYNKTIDIIKAEKLNDMKNMLTKTSQSLNSELLKLQKTAQELSSNSGLRKTVQDFDKFNQMQKDRLKDYYAREFNNIVATPYIQKVYCISRAEESCFLDEKLPEGIQEFLKTPLYKDFMRSESNELWYHANAASSKDDADKPKTFFVCEKLKGVGAQDGKPLDMKEDVGYIFFLLNTDILQRSMSEAHPGLTGGQSLYDSFLNPLGEDILKQFPKDQITELVTHNEDIVQREVRMDDYTLVISAQKIQPAGWHLVTVTSISNLAKPVQDALKNSFWLIGLVGIIASLWIVIEILVMTRLITDKEKSDYRLIMSEDVNQKFRIYKHDWMNHLQIIQGLIQIGEPLKALEYTNKLTEEGKNINSKYDIGIPELESAIFSAVASAQDKGIEVKLDCMRLPDNLKIKVFDLVKILVNLLKNALYALEHANSPEKILEIHIYEELGEYVFEIVNNVPAIPKDLQKRIFEKGFTTKAEEGDGLGLFIVRKLAEKNMGTIELRVDERGNHFFLRLPN